MTAVTLTELSVTDIPMEVKSGTVKRRAIVALRYTSAAASDTLALATYIPGIADIEGILWNTNDNKEAGTAVTWSTTTLTAAGHGGAGVAEVGLIVNFS